MCFHKSTPAPPVLPAQAVAAQPVASSANVKTAVKRTDKIRDSGADLRTDAVTTTTPTPIANVPSTGKVSLGSKRLRKGVVGLDL